MSWGSEFVPAMGERDWAMPRAKRRFLRESFKQPTSSGTDTRTFQQVYGFTPRASSIALAPAAPQQIEALSGQAPPAARQSAAVAASPLQVSQAAMAVGEPLPVIFGRRRNGIGGVLVFPRATEARFENNASTVTSRYHCVLSEGRLGNIQVRDVRNGECRLGSFSQNYGQRAGSWTPGNFATAQTAYQVPTFPTFTGGGGNYAGLTTFEAGATFPGGSDDWRTGWNVFVRDGLIIERGRLLDAVVGSSDNIADLVLWAWQGSSRVPAAMIDLTSLTDAARFCDANGLLCNGEFKDSQNLGDWLIGLLPSFLLRETRIGGKYGLRPLLPANANGTIKTTAITPRWLLNEASIIPDSLQISYVDAATRRPPTFQILWRQQATETDIPVPRTLAAGSPNALSSFEQVDLSGFCTSELHAARVGAYRYWRRVLTTHTATVKLRPGTQSGQIAEGDVVQIYLSPEVDREEAMAYNAYYQVESVGLSWNGEEVLSLSHFPVDPTGRSLLALAVAGVTTIGDVLPAQKTGSSCDAAGSSTDTTVPSSSTSGTPLYRAPTLADPAQAYNGATWAAAGGINLLDWAAGIDWTGGPPSPTVAANGAITPAPAGDGDPGTYPGDYEGTLYKVIIDNILFGGSSPTFCSIVPPVITFPTPETGYGPNNGVRIVVTPPASAGYPPGYTYDISDGAASGYDGPFVIGPCGNPPAPIPGSDPNPPTACPWTYTVKPGDTLWGIAERYYGNGSKWPAIYAQNTGTIGSDPDLIFPGQTFTIPCP